jgi:hypothetical protein
MLAPECDLSDTEIYLRQALEALKQIIFLRDMRIRVLEDQCRVNEECAPSKRRGGDSQPTESVNMPSKDVPHKFKHGKLHSGSKSGPVVKNPAQMKAILMSEKRKEKQGRKP